MKLLTMTAWRRPGYFKEVIESLEEAEGIDEYLLLVSIDGGYPDKQDEMMNILGKSSLNYEHYCQKENIGCAGNTGFILKEGFSRAERVIHVEDDTVFHRDAIQWFESNLDEYEQDERIFSVSGYTNGEMNKIALDGDWTENNIVGIRKKFTCWGWATWKRVWDEMEGKWFGIIWKEGRHGENCGTDEEFLDAVVITDEGSWGWPMSNYWLKDRYEISPHTSFIQNIGEKEGKWASPQYQRIVHHTDWFRSDKRVNMEDLDRFFINHYFEGVVS